jgi:putative ABC transport system ATP-binding protein
MPRHIIELKDVHKTYMLGEVPVHVLKGVTLAVKEGESLGVIGRSGSGKSTLLNIMGVLDRPTRGHVYVDDKDVSTLDDNSLAKIRGEKIGFVFQFFYLIPTLSALENIQLPMTFVNRVHKKRAVDLLKKVGLGKRMKFRPTQLSGGERQRAAIARALANDPEVILADEPTGNLDSKTGKEIIDLLIKLNKKEGKTIVVITHDKSLANQMDRVVHIEDGKIITKRRR